MIRTATEYHEKTSYRRDTIGGHSLDWDNQPFPFKIYPGDPIALPREISLPRGSLSSLLTGDIAARETSSALSVKTLAEVMHLTYSLTAKSQYPGGEVYYRSVASAGALYPVETYLAAHAVEDIPAGIYHYAVRTHELEQLQAGDFRLPTAQAALDQDMAYSAGVVFFWTAVFERAKWKYRQRAYRYVDLDAGHIAQNLALAAEALQLGSCQIAALYDEEVNTLLGLDGTSESVLYMSVVGHPLV